MAYKSPILQIDSFAAVVRNDRKVTLHPGHVEPLIEHAGKLIVKAL
jgi:hypothetical protein